MKKIFHLLFAIILLSGISNASAKQVIILNITTDPGQVQVTYLLWITTSSPIALPGAVSAWKGASPAENATIAAGTTIEIQRVFAAPAGTSKAAVQAALQAIYTQTQNITTSQPTGCFFDGATWSC